MRNLRANLKSIRDHFVEMTVYDDLTVIDEFEAKHGNRLAVECACDLMVALLESISLPRRATEALDLALNYRKGLVGTNELKNARDALTEHTRRNLENLPDQQIVEAVSALLWFLQHPSWGGGASEIVSNFLDLLGEPEKKSETIIKLLAEKFGE